MLEKILVPVDGSKRAEAVFGQLRLLLEGPETEVLVLRAAYVPSALRGIDHTSLLVERVAEARTCVENLAYRLRQSGIRARGVVCEQYPAGAILDTAQAEGVALIAMSSHGCTGVNQWLFGSVALKVLQASHIPVLVMPSFEAAVDGEPAPSGTHPFRPKRILVPTDGSRLSLAVVPMAGELAHRFGAEILTLYVEDGAPKPAALAAASRGGDRFQRAGIEEAHDPNADPAVAACDCFVPIRVHGTPVHAVGDPASRILELSRAEGVDLIAMATHGSNGGIFWSFGSVTQKVLCSSRLPMLVVRPQMEYVP
jgi:nucleotide-binding universal stress UspA family protein